MQVAKDSHVKFWRQKVVDPTNTNCFTTNYYYPPFAHDKFSITYQLTVV